MVIPRPLKACRIRMPLVRRHILSFGRFASWAKEKQILPKRAGLFISFTKPLEETHTGAGQGEVRIFTIDLGLPGSIRIWNWYNPEGGGGVSFLELLRLFEGAELNIVSIRQSMSWQLMLIQGRFFHSHSMQVVRNCWLAVANKNSHAI